MEIYKDIPFYPNTDDNTHCFQAAFKMVLKYFYPKEKYSIEELDKITGKVESLWTWPTAGLIWLQEKGLKVANIDAFDYEEFIKKGGKYLIEEYGEEVGDEQIKNSDIEQEISLAKQFVNLVDTKKEIPEIDDIKNLLKEDNIIIVNLNSRVLDGKGGYCGHSVVIKGLNNKEFIINDPGLPGIENRKVDFNTFKKAWAYPNEKSKNIMAFKLD